MHDWFWCKNKATSTLICFRLKTETSYRQRIESNFRPHYNGKTAFSNVSNLESVFEKFPFHRPHYNRKTSFSNLSTLESVFVDRRRRISVDEMTNRIKKYPFSNENGLVWMGHKTTEHFGLEYEEQ